ncbi:hypothetical protein ACEWPL_002735 [Roseovarius sp. S1116L3]|uniref:hypothetical protein n=1 Tax=Roseovarius roseus TaxID=3342636 RepID=UPI003728C51F
MTESTSNKSEDLKQQAKAASADLGASARDATQDAAGAVREEATRRAESAKSGVADEVSDVATALRKAADDMRNGSPQERTIGQIAGGLADVSDTIRDKDLGQMAEELSGFAKRNPLLFLGGVALAGFAATRFATASARRDSNDVQPDPYQSASSVHASHRPASPSINRTAGVRPTSGGAS